MADVTVLPFTARLLDATETARLERGELITAKREPSGLEVQAVMRCRPKRVFDLMTDYRNMPDHIAGLRSADVQSEIQHGGQHLQGSHHQGTSSVRFMMKLPFPVGRLTWTNLIQTRELNEHHVIEWTLVDGDLKANDGRLVLSPYRGQATLTHARYFVNVVSRSALPKAAERLATRWLVPTIVKKIRRVVERSDASSLTIRGTLATATDGSATGE